MTDFDPFDETWPETAKDAPRTDEAGQPVDLHSKLVRDEVRRLRAQRDARAILAAEGRSRDPFDAGTLAEVLGRPEEPAARVETLIPWQASTLVVAQRKTGKTTWSLNLARCLVTGEPFLGSMAVRPINPDAKVGLLNFEVSGAQLARWAHECGVPAERLFLVNLRGRRNPLTDTEDRADLADLLRAQRVETLIVDPFGRAFSGESQNDAGQVGSWLIGLDEFARANVGALDVILTAHAGWNGERSRGSSALEDWADSIITLTRDEETGERFIRATGRDVDLDEDRLDFDPVTRLLRLSGNGSRQTAAQSRKDTDTERDILDALKAAPQGLSGNELATKFDRKDADFTRVRNELVKRNLITAHPRSGRGAGWTYRLISPEPTEPPENLPNVGYANLPNLPYRGEVQVRDVQSTNIPRPLECRCGQPTAAGKVLCPSCLASFHRGGR